MVLDNYHKLADKELVALETMLDELLPDADIDLLGDNLSVTLSSGSTYIINKHVTTQQIWVASPISGAHHFAYKDGHWMNTRTGDMLSSWLKNEIKNNDA